MDFLASDLLNLLDCLKHVIFAERDQTDVFFVVFLLLIHSSEFHSECIIVLFLELGFLELHLFDDTLELVINVLHVLDFLNLHVFSQLETF